MKKLILFALLITTTFSLAQIPFTTLAREPVTVKEIINADNTVGYTLLDVENIRERAESDTETSFETLYAKETEDNTVTTNDNKENADFFKNSSLALSIYNDNETRASISAQVIYYKINLFTPLDPKSKNFRYNIPLMLISKLSTNYDSISASSAIDVLDYEASPITLRIMPSFKLSKNKTYSQITTFGFYADARSITINNNNPDIENVTSIIGSGGIGFTFQGDGQAGEYNQNSELENGNWSFSLMYQGAFGDKTFIQSLFDTKNNFVTSFQSYFLFKVDDKSKFNLKVGYQHFFQKSIAGNKNMFSIAIGI